MFLSPLRLGAAVIALFLAACATSQSPLHVDTFHLRDTDVSSRASESLAYAEKKYRLHGHVSQAQREQQKGHYYSIRWKAEPGAGPVTLRLRYQQARTGAQILTRSVTRDSAEGSTQIVIKGNDYAKGGRVLAWKLELLQAGQLLASEQSYLWE